MDILLFVYDYKWPGKCVVSAHPKKILSFDDAASYCVDKKVAVILNQALVSDHYVELPKLSKRKLIKLAPFAIEDQLAVGLESVHVALNNVAAKSQVSVIARNTLDELLQSLRKADITAIYVGAVTEIIRAIACPADCGLIVLDNNNDTFYIKIKDEMLSFQEEELEHYLELLVSQDMKWEIYFPQDNESVLQRFAKLNIAKQYSYTNIAKVYGQVWPTVTNPQNLLQNEYAVKSKLYINKILTWVCIGMLSALVVLFCAERVILYWQAQDEIADIQASITQEYSKVFPNKAGLDNPRMMISRKVNELRKEEVRVNYFSLLLSYLGRAFSGTKGITLENSFYKDKNLLLSCKVNDVAELQKMLKKLNENTELRAEQSSLTSSQNYYTAKLSIRYIGT